MRENADQNNSEKAHFSRSVINGWKTWAIFAKKATSLFHDGGPYHIQTSPMNCYAMIV